MKIKALVIIVLFICNSTTIFSQKEWTLIECIFYALENNLTIKKSQVNREISQENLIQSKRDLIPSLGFSSSAGSSFGRSIDPNTNDVVQKSFFNNSYSLWSSLTVFNGFRQKNRIQYQRFQSEMSELDLLKEKDELAFRITNLYYEILFNKALIEIANQQIIASELKLRTLEKKVSLGLKPKSDLYELQSSLEKEKYQKILAENIEGSLKLQLVQEMNFKKRNIVLYQDTLQSEQSLFSLKEDQLLENFLQYSTEYNTQLLSLKSNEKQLAIARSGLLPSIHASASLNTGFYETNIDDQGNVIGFTSQMMSNQRQYIGLSLNFPIFSSWSSRSNIKKAKLQLISSKIDLELNKQKLYFNLTNELNELKSLLAEYKHLLQQNKSDQASLHVAGKKLEKGLISVLEFYQIKNRFANTESLLFKIKYSIEIKQKKLKFYEGIRFWELNEN